MRESESRGDGSRVKRDEYVGLTGGSNKGQSVRGFPHGVQEDRERVKVDDKSSSFKVFFGKRLWVHLNQRFSFLMTHLMATDLRCYTALVHRLKHIWKLCGGYKILDVGFRNCYKIGKPIKVNVITKEAGCGRFARACAQIDLGNSMISKITVDDHLYEVEYKSFGHIQVDCGMKHTLPAPETPTKTPPALNNPVEERNKNIEKKMVSSMNINDGDIVTNKAKMLHAWRENHAQENISNLNCYEMGWTKVEEKRKRESRPNFCSF
ncbi:hypothetical protein PIB30_033715 [Stylosanthes scabra]|uniref:DUF4283 domain-containing protein n=1 Tax=Stylosanthes scabra TaxID=79078 RepID=A0ABU6YBJ6_9FABA|nr:hypothetical protein [Stylosanthes scabra]